MANRVAFGIALGKGDIEADNLGVVVGNKVEFVG